MSDEDDVLDMVEACDSISEEVCDAANFFAAEGGSGEAFHRMRPPRTAC